MLTCSMCGTLFDPEGQTACQACPLHAGCELVRCPACGFETVDPRRSGIARLAARFFKKNGGGATSAKALSLRDAPLRRPVQIAGFSSQIPAQRLAQMQAYGLAPGQEVRVIQHSPVTILEIDYLELALEKDLAEGIEITIAKQEEPWR